MKSLMRMRHKKRESFRQESLHARRNLNKRLFFAELHIQLFLTVLNRIPFIKTIYRHLWKKRLRKIK